MDSVFSARKDAYKPNLVTQARSRPQVRRVEYDAAASLRRRKTVQAKRRRWVVTETGSTGSAGAGSGAGSGGGVAPPTLPSAPSSAPPPSLSVSSPAPVSWSSDSLAATLKLVQGGPTIPDRDQLGALKHLRLVLSQDDQAIQPCLDAGVVDVLTRLLESGHDEHKLEATWCLANIAVGSSKQTEAVLVAVPQLIGLLQCGNPILAEHAAWVVANVAGDDCSDYRRRMAAMGAVGALVPLMKSMEVPVRRTALWAMSNLLIGDDMPAMPFATSGVVEPLLATLAAVPPNVECCGHAARCLSLMASREVEVATGLVTMGAVAVLVPPLASPDPGLCRSALRAIGNCIAVGDSQVQAAVAIPAFLPNLVGLLARLDPADPSRKEALWVMSNVTGGTPDHAGALVTAGALPLLAAAVSKGSFEVQREAGVALLNIALQSGPLLAATVAEPGVLKAFIAFAKAFDVGLVRLGLTMVEVTLRRHPSGTTLVEEAGGFDALESLEFRVTSTPLASPPDPKRPDISTWAALLLREFGDGNGDNDDDDDDDKIAAISYYQNLTQSNTHSDEVLVLFTSGTTGSKKCVPHLLGDMLVATATICVSWDLTITDVNCNIMPLFHVGGIIH